MKRIQLTVIAAAVFTLFTSQAFAQHRSLEGLAIGGSAGAIAGQAIGRDAESTIIGATIGGVLGAVIGGGIHSHHHVVTPAPVVHHYRAPAPVVHHYSTPAPVVYHYRTPAPVVYRDRPHFKPRYREHCRETVRTKGGHHKSKTVVSTVCWTDGGKRHGKKHFGNDHRRGYSDWNRQHHRRF